MKRTVIFIGPPLALFLLLSIYLVITSFSPMFLKPEKEVQPIQTTLQKKHHPLKIVAIGDSLTQGVGDPSKKGYVGDTAKLLENQAGFSPVSYKNYGVRGDTTDDLLKVLQKKDVIANIQKADMIFITIGGNDLLDILEKHFLNLKMSYFTNQREHYKENAEKILTILEDNNPKATIYYMGLFNPFEDYFQNIDEFNRIVQRWNDTTQSLLEQHPNTVFVPIYDIFVGKADTLISKEDHLHPNPVGYEVMSNRLYDYIREKMDE